MLSLHLWTSASAAVKLQSKVRGRVPATKAFLVYFETGNVPVAMIFSERELMFMFAIYVVVRPSVCLSSVCRLSVCNVRAPYSAD